MLMLTCLHPNNLINFNLDFYTEVQDLSYLENVLNTVSPCFTALNMAFISVIKDFGLVGSETLAVEVHRTSPSVAMLCAGVNYIIQRIKHLYSISHMSLVVQQDIYLYPPKMPLPQKASK